MAFYRLLVNVMFSLHYVIVYIPPKNINKLVFSKHNVPHFWLGQNFVKIFMTPFLKNEKYNILLKYKNVE